MGLSRCLGWIFSKWLVLGRFLQLFNSLCFLWSAILRLILKNGLQRRQLKQADGFRFLNCVLSVANSLKLDGDLALGQLHFTWRVLRFSNRFEFITFYCFGGWFEITFGQLGLILPVYLNLWLIQMLLKELKSLLAQSFSQRFDLGSCDKVWLLVIKKLCFSLFSLFVPRS